MPPQKQKVRKKQKEEEAGLKDQVETEESDLATNFGEVKLAISNPRLASPSTLIHLQQNYGNQAVQRLIKSGGESSIQRFKLNNLFKKKPKGATFVPISQIGEALKNKEFFRLFYEFAVEEYATENVECWADVEAFKGSPNIPRAKRIFNQFFADANSKLSVNIGGSARKDLQKKMDEMQSEEAGLFFFVLLPDYLFLGGHSFLLLAITKIRFNP